MTDAPHHTDFCFDYPDERRARVVGRAVAVEVGAIDGNRSRADVAIDGRRVRLAIDADDLVALRAASNTWLSLVGAAERTAAIRA